MKDSSGWSRGYPVAEPYPAAWHHFQSPAHIATVCALMGFAWEVGPDTPLAIAEIGCGSGYTANLLAAGNPNAEVFGLDYNPAHIAEARSMAAAAGLANSHFEEVDLAELDGAALDRLPEFDLVTVHGLWSWVGDPVREGVLRLLQRRLKPGGVVLVSYNALPGAATALGLSRLVRAQLRTADSTEAGIATARALVEQLMAAEARHMLPSTWRNLLLGEMGTARQGYLLHEFLTDHWRPAFFSDVRDALATARCDFIGSATLDENFPAMQLSPDQQAIWNAAPDLDARQLILDLCVPRAFRRDVFIRGPRRIAREAAVAAIPLVIATRDPAERKIRSQAGEATLPPHIFEPMRAALDSGPRTVAELLALPGCGNVTPTEALGLLVGSGLATPLWRRPDAGLSACARRLNAVAAARLAPHGLGSATVGLACPALGGALSCGPMELAVANLLATRPAGDDGEDIPTLVRRLLPPGPPPPAEVFAELEGKFTALLRDRRQVWRDLGIA